MPTEVYLEPAETLLTDALDAELRRLRRVVAAARGFFALFPVENDLNDETRDAVQEQLRDYLAASGRNLRHLRLTPGDWDVLSTILTAGPFAEDDVVLLTGLEALSAQEVDRGRPKALTALNVQREALEDALGVPLILWCSSVVYDYLLRFSPDFFDHLVATFQLRQPSPATDPGRQIAHAPADGYDQPVVTESRGMSRPAIEAAIAFYNRELQLSADNGEDSIRAKFGLVNAYLELSAFGSRGSADMAADLLHQILSSLSEFESPEWEAMALHQLGILAEERRQFDEAEGWYRQSLEIEEQFGNDHGKASTLHQLGILAQKRRQFDEAEGWYRQSLEIKDRLGDDHGKASTLHQLGRIAEEQRQFDEAEDYYRRSLEINERIGDDHGKAMSLHHLGRIAQERRQFDEAEEYYCRSLEIKDRLGDDHGKAMSLHQLGRTAEERRQFDEAEEYYRRSLEIKDRLGNDHGKAMSLHQLGRIAEEQRQFDEAEEYYRRSLEINERIGDDHGIAISLHQLGRIAQDQRLFDEAERLYSLSAEIFRRTNDPFNLKIAESSLSAAKRNRLAASPLLT